MSTSESDIVARISALNLPVPGETQDAPVRQPEADTADAEHVDTGTDAPDTSPTAESEGDGGEAASTDTEEIEIGDLNDLATHLGVDASELYNIAVPYTKDGQKAEFTLGEIKDNFQKFQEAETLRAEAQAQRETYEQANTQAQELIQAHVLQAEAISKGLEQALLQDFGGVNWAHLQATNPGEYIRLSQQFNNRQAQLQKMRQDAGQFIEGQVKQLGEQQEHLKQQMLVREQAALFKAIPEWRDQGKAEAERQALAHHMIERGYTEAEIDAVTDHRAILLVRDAMRYRQQKASGEVAAKKVVKLAKRIVTPGSRQSASEQSSDQERGYRQNLKRSGSVQDAAALIQYRLGRKK